MDTLSQLKEELKNEYETAEAFFDRFPEGKNDYAPHEKSMKLMSLVSHSAEVFAWPKFILNTWELDFGKGDDQSVNLSTKAELQQKLEVCYNVGIASLEAATEDQLEPNWAIKNNGETMMEWT